MPTSESLGEALDGGGVVPEVVLVDCAADGMEESVQGVSAEVVSADVGFSERVLVHESAHRALCLVQGWLTTSASPVRGWR